MVQVMSVSVRIGSGKVFCHRSVWGGWMLHQTWSILLCIPFMTQCFERTHNFSCSCFSIVKHFLLFYFSGQLEVFHNALLKYCPKRLHFQYPSMKARTMLAVMDHNENHSTKREQATTAAGGYSRNANYCNDIVCFPCTSRCVIHTWTWSSHNWWHRYNWLV